MAGPGRSIENSVLDAHDMYVELKRVFQRAGNKKLVFPCDEEEKDRLDLYHKIISVARGDRLHQVPIQSHGEAQVLDVGCGTGIWALDMADAYPRPRCSVNVIGVDLSMIQPEDIAPNLSFIRLDVEGDWHPLEENSFSLIHVQTLFGCIADWPKFYSQAYRYLLPVEGFLEQVEIDWQFYGEDGEIVSDEHVVQRWYNDWMEAMDRHGRSMRVDPERTRRQLQDAGFVDIQVERIELPTHGWHSDPRRRDIGRWFNLGLTTEYGLESLDLMPFNRYHRLTKEEVHSMNELLKRELSNRHSKFFCHLYVWTGRRPN